MRALERDEPKSRRILTTKQLVPPPMIVRVDEPGGFDELVIRQQHREATGQQRRRKEGQKPCLTHTEDVNKDDEEQPEASAKTPSARGGPLMQQLQMRVLWIEPRGKLPTREGR